MIQEALSFLYEQIKNDNNPEPIVRRVTRRQQAVTVRGVTVIEDLDLPVLRRSATNLASLSLLIEEFKGKKPTIFVSEKGIVVVLDDSDRYEQVVMDFVLSDQFQQLDRIAAGMGQKQLVTLLRTKLAGCIANDTILAMIRQIEFDVNRASRGAVSHTEESMGRSIHKQVKAKAGDIPEEIIIRLPMFSVPNDVPSEIELVMAVDIDMEAEKIALIPTGNSLSRARQGVIESIISRIETLIDDDVILVAGSVSGSVS